MPKVLSRSGTSLADVYDVEGSIAGVEQLLTADVQVVHEMGATIMSERLRTQILRLTSGAIAQNTDIDAVFTAMPGAPARILAVAVIVDTSARLSRLAVHARDPDAGQEIPLWVFAGGTDHTIRIADDGGAAADVTLLTPDNYNAPNLLGGNLHVPSAHEFSMRGRTSGFGAGTVEATALVQVAFAEVGGVNSKGLPLPGW